MTVELVTALCAGIGVIITAVGAIFVAVYNTRFLKQDARKKDVQLERIHVLVNSRLTKALKEIAELRTLLIKSGNAEKIPTENV